MEKMLYSNLGNKLNKTYKENKTEFNFKDFLNHKFNIDSDSEFKLILERELKNVLVSNDLFDLIQKFFELEEDFYQSVDLLDFQFDTTCFDNLYRNFSPLLLKSLLLNKKNISNEDGVLKLIQEALRISIEEIINEEI